MSSPRLEEQFRFLLLVDRGMLPLEIEQKMAEAKEKLSAELGLPNVCVTDSRSWYQQEFTRCGSWDAWIWETINGRDYLTRKAHFNGFIATKSVQGRANASLIGQALQKKAPVLQMRPEASLVSVSEVLEIDPQSWVDGWLLATQEIGVTT